MRNIYLIQLCDLSGLMTTIKIFLPFDKANSYAVLFVFLHGFDASAQLHLIPVREIS